MRSRRSNHRNTRPQSRQHSCRDGPQFDLGHLELAERIHSRASRFPGLALAGNSYRGIGVPDCIKSGESAAERIFSQLEKSMTCRRQSA